MSARRLEAFLARLYTDAGHRRDFLAAPADAARRAGLDEVQAAALAAIDRDDLELACRSYAGKRAQHAAKPRSAGLLARLRRFASRRG